MLFLNNVMKRAFDFTFALLGLFFLAPLFLGLAVLIKRDSPGPIVFRGLRAGRNGRNFHILKFRTMYETPDAYGGPQITALDDPRVTRLGRWLRDTKLNELPQLWNVLVGEMSLVGPRPEHPDIVGRWPEPTQKEILSVRPGITSPASVLYRDEETRLRFGDVMKIYLGEVLPSKLRLDTLYVRNHSFLTDLDVLFWTLVVLLPSARKKTVPEHLLFWGPLSVLFSRYLNWFVVDTLVAFAAVVVSGLIWRSDGPMYLGIGVAVSIAIGIALGFGLINFLLGLDRVAWSRASAEDALDLILPSGLVTLGWLALDNVWPAGALIPQGMVLVTGILAFLGFVAVRYQSRILTGLATRWMRARRSAHGMRERILVVGAGEGGRFGVRLLRSAGFAEIFSLVGMVDDDPRIRGMRIDSCTVVGRTEDIPSLVEKYNVDLLLFAIYHIRPEDRQRILALCQMTQLRIVFLPEITHLLRPQLAQNNGSHLSNRDRSTLDVPVQGDGRFPRAT